MVVSWPDHRNPVLPIYYNDGAQHRNENRINGGIGGKTQMKVSKYLFLGLLVNVLSFQIAVAESYEPARNTWGQPQIGGIWSNATTTPFTRPKSFGNQLILKENQAAKIQSAAEDYAAAGNVRTDPNAGAPDDKNTAAGYNRFWTDPGTQVMYVNGEPRSSLITFPADGRLPPRLPGAKPYGRRKLPPGGAFTEAASIVGPRDNPEQRGLSERCIFMNTSAGPVMRPTLYNNNYLITQGKDAVSISVEMIHDTRIVRIGGKHRNDGVKQWMGDSIGWYENNTLIVETIDFRPEQQFFGASEQLKVTERFTPVAEDRLLYQFTVEDPKTWAEPWGGEYEFWASPGFYEYACHEGNIGLEGILAGGRQADREGE
jgi:hypothetical protein